MWAKWRRLWLKNSGRPCAATSTISMVVLSAIAMPATAQRSSAPTLPDSALETAPLRLIELQRRVTRSPNDATAWHELGLLTWALSDVARARSAVNVEWMRLGRLSDSALAMAAAIAADSTAYQLDAARRFLASNIAIARSGSQRYYERAMRAARASRVTADIAAAALEYGRTFWWRFDALENRHRFASDVTPRSVADALNPLSRGAAKMEDLRAYEYALENASIKGRESREPWRDPKLWAEIQTIIALGTPANTEFMSLPKNTFKGAQNFLETQAIALPADLAGAPAYEQATALFREAYAAAPLYPGAFRALAMTFAARGLWGNLDLAARAHLAVSPRDSIAWLSLGLARARLGHIDAARAAFDSALATMNVSERTRIDAYTRITPPAPTPSVTPAAAREALYWQTANPLWADSSYDAHVEFLARVTYAELRWTVEEFALPGADSDRGDIFIRYGPPQRTLSFGPAVEDKAADVVMFWLYPSGLIFAFSGMPTFATMRTPSDDVPLVDEIKNMVPVQWDNLGFGETDSLDLAIARFRGVNADSLDLAVTVAYGPPDSIAQSAAVAGTVERHFWIARPGGAIDVHQREAYERAESRLWRSRVAPGTMLSRSESYLPTARRAARGTTVIDATTPAFPLSGFGISDPLVVATIAEPGSTPRRWTDLAVTPGSTVYEGSSFGVLWENYQLGAEHGSADYDITLTLTRQQTAGGRLKAEIVGALAKVALLDVSRDAVVAHLHRSVPEAPILTDWITVQLPDASPGRYTLEIDVKDRITGKSATRATSIVVRKRN